ncbi:MAG: dual specificity protein phosphatase family protein [Thermodesulfobacteriota bacterium]
MTEPKDSSTGWLSGLRGGLISSCQQLWRRIIATEPANNPEPPTIDETRGAYNITWITAQIGVGYAPMSYKELDFIREQGIGAIVNLCGEFCDLHEIEEKSGFEVYYLPIPDECAPDMEKMEAALEWLDEALYLKKKVLIHCRHGHGRTGTFVSAYLLRRGLGLKFTEKALKRTRANPTNYSQWNLLKKYSKEQGNFTARQPSIADKQTVDLHPFLSNYEQLLDERANKALETDSCCHQPFHVQLVEAVYLSEKLNAILDRQTRHEVLERALAMAKISGKQTETEPPYRCPLLVDSRCLLEPYRPMHCRFTGRNITDENGYEKRIESISKNIFLALTNSFPPEQRLTFSMVDTLSGRYVQLYFQAMTQKK